MDKLSKMIILGGVITLIMWGGAVALAVWVWNTFEIVAR